MRIAVAAIVLVKWVHVQPVSVKNLRCSIHGRLLNPYESLAPRS